MDARQSTGLEALRQHDKANAHRALWLTLELLNLHRHLQARGLEVLPYKGPVLAEALYGNVALRQFSDLDLLVRSHDLPRIKAALAELGYAPGLRLAQAAERDYLKSGYEYTFDGARGRNLLEIKWQILPRFYSIGFDVDDFFERASVVTIEGQKLRTLCDQDLMLVLCVHAAKHAWRQISWLSDIVQLARSRAIDWAALRADSERLGIARIVAVTFQLAPQPPWSRVAGRVRMGESGKGRSPGAAHRAPDCGGRRIRCGGNGLFSLDDGIAGAQARPAFFLVAAAGHSRCGRMVGSAVARPAVSAVSRSTGLPAGREVDRAAFEVVGGPDFEPSRKALNNCWCNRDVTTATSWTCAERPSVSVSFGV